MASITDARWTYYLCCVTPILLMCLIFIQAHNPSPTPPYTFLGALKSETSKLQGFQTCAIRSFLATGLPFLNTASPLPISEYTSRRNNLARALIADGIDAFIVEPGYTFEYYANISQADWEPWEPEERPFLMIVQPIKDASGGSLADTTFLAPAFEAERVRLLGMPFADGDRARIVTWEEHWDPYRTLYNAGLFSGSRPKVMVDEEMRDFIQRGLARQGFDVVGLAGNVERVRQTKTAREIEILRAVNSGTVEAIRAMRRCMYTGVTEAEVSRVLDETLWVGGLEPFFDIVLFDEDAANPHGGTGGSKRLEAETFVLIDVGAHLYGYSSDVCRTFFPPFLPRTEEKKGRLAEKLRVWDIVFKAQSESIRQLREGETAASVDIAARRVIEEAGYGETFTHRVGHGIGIKAHESPYLHKGNNETLLRPGMPFTTEPGVYLIGKFGVRHEDVFLVTEDGEPECLSCPRALDPWKP